MKKDLGYGWCANCNKPLTKGESNELLCEKCLKEIDA